MKSKGVFISTLCKESLSVILLPSRVFGLSPFAIIEYGDSRVYKINFCGFYALYSCFIGFLIPTIILTGLVLEGLNHQYSLDPAISINQYVLYLDVAPIGLCVFIGIASLMLRRNAFLDLMRDFTKIDGILNLKNASTLRSHAIRQIVFMFIVLSILIIYSSYIWYFVEPPFIEGTFSYFYYAALSFGNVSTVIIILQYYVVNDSVRFRVKSLSRRLDVDNLVISGNNNDALVKRSRKKQLHAICLLSDEYIESHVAAGKNNPNSSGRCLLTSQYLNNMLDVYENVQDSMRNICFVYGPGILVIMMVIVLNFIISSYFVIIYLLTNVQMARVFKELIWTVYHLIRLIMIVEPSHRLSAEIEVIRLKICKLMMHEAESDAETQIETFSNKLLLAPSSFFSPCNMFDVNRSLLTTVSTSF
ncbi:gustatory receptor for sugar taste 43a-like [Atheta coriaria]|uniref:gustatory receptor for sugar taste 43a-like n=1 Tax=Dalotia coriaria TaxID=877792 RepID=UPI0031F35CA7